jgi:tetratricopeptide (TPR) repeat protein
MRGWALALMFAVVSQGGSPAPLVRYSFDSHVDTGPDTFAVFQHAKGTVRLVSSPRLSGFRALEIRDVARDGTFPELQGYFAVQRRGRLYAHFAFLVTETTQDLNIALAGPAHFTIRKDGMAFWLAVKDGWLVHYPATKVLGPSRLAAVGRCVSKPIARVEPFLWYVVDVAYDIDCGVYDLTIRLEGRADPVAVLSKQPVASGAVPTAVDKFSFIGDLDDAFAATYYVDDVVIGTDEAIAQLPFVAPGRRRLFVDRFADAERQTRERSCLPVQDAADFGLSGSDIDALRRADALGALASLAAGAPFSIPEGASLGPDTRRRVDAAFAWAQGCAALPDDPAKALDAFARAGRLAPEASIVAPSSVLALAQLGRGPEAEEGLRGLAWEWRQDPRYGVLLAVVGATRGRLAEAEAWLRTPAEATPNGADEPPLVAEAYYYVLLAKGDHALAQDYAQRLAARIAPEARAAPEWLERAGDAAVRLGRLAEAKALYERSRALSAYPASAWLRLSDVAWLERDLARERSYREAIFGQLRETR